MSPLSGDARLALFLVTGVSLAAVATSMVLEATAASRKGGAEPRALGGVLNDRPGMAARDAALKAKAQAATRFTDSCQVPAFEDFTPQPQPIRPGTIFVSVASYRDDECKETIADMYIKAADPDRIFVGAVQQNRETNEDCFESCDTCRARKMSGHIRVLDFRHTEARGPTFARFQASKLWAGEQYYMQIDSHTRFEPRWDETVLRELAATNDPKAIVGGYPPTREQMDNFRASGWAQMITMCGGIINPAGVPVLEAGIVNTPKDGKPVKMFWSGANMIMPAQALLDVPYDPYLAFLFFGEEILHSARLWTSGYNFYAPKQNFIAHHYGREGKPRFWDDNARSRICEEKAVQRVRYLLGRIGLAEVSADFRRDLDKYGMGKERTLRQYYKQAGVDWGARRMRNDCPGNFGWL